MRLISNRLILGSVIVLAAFRNHTTETDYSGKWILNHEKTAKASGAHRMAQRTMQVSQDNQHITITNSVRGTETVSSFSFDGKETVVKLTETNSRRVTAAWSADKKELIFSYVMYIGDNPTGMEGEDTWQLADGSLSITTLYGTGNSQRTSVEIYDK